MMGKQCKSLLAWISLFFVLGIHAEAQSAEPLRLQVNKATHTVLIKGSIRDRQQAEYVTSVGNGRHMTLQFLNRSDAAVTVRIRTPRDTDLTPSVAGHGTLTATAPEAGDYEIWVKRLQKTPGQSSYRLRLSVK